MPDTRRPGILNVVTRTAVLFGALAFLASSPAWAEGPADSYNRESLTELPSNLRLPTDAVTPAPAADAPRANVKKSKGSSLSYKALLGGLVITRDLVVPGSAVSVRVLPTSSAIGGGSSAPILLRPRVDGSGRYGFHMVAKF